jgi:hypothetical protein
VPEPQAKVGSASPPITTLPDRFAPPCTSALFFTTALPVTVAPPLTQARSSIRALPETVLLPYTAARGPTYALAATLARPSTQPPPLECHRPPPGAAGLTWPGS